ncbi:hypothetical protein E2P81_ATG00814 [Venturia nashicola]|uniref:Uncharacterized protein n=1 Tax=Venturia nashicola TaxID=86259 RepID=A0A4Z1PTL0_9PEZI|nr:hypothetical protein E6O75_ATG00832 [Venturia nashicola]TLD38271.1 hypothetical protein E2P81_ATG00814 [Venturia nashicola]
MTSHVSIKTSADDLGSFQHLSTQALEGLNQGQDTYTRNIALVTDMAGLKNARSIRAIDSNAVLVTMPISRLTREVSISRGKEASLRDWDGDDIEGS